MSVNTAAAVAAVIVGWLVFTIVYGYLRRSVPPYEGLRYWKCDSCDGITFVPLGTTPEEYLAALVCVYCGSMAPERYVPKPCRESYRALVAEVDSLADRLLAEYDDPEPGSHLPDDWEP